MLDSSIKTNLEITVSKPNQMVQYTGITTEQTVSDLYQYAEQDRERAVESYERIKNMVDSSSKVTPGMLEALNGAQNLIQTSTDKLIHVAKLMNSKDSVKTLNQMNFNFDKNILDDEVEDLETKSKRLGVKKR